MEKLELERQLQHVANPMLQWIAASLVVEMDAARNLKRTKKKSTECIDGIVTTMMALGRAIHVPQFKCVCETRGLMVL